LPVPVKLMVVVAVPLVTVWEGTVFTVGRALMVAVTATVWLVAPDEVSVTEPAMVPVEAEAAERT